MAKRSEIKIDGVPKTEIIDRWFDMVGDMFDIPDVDAEQIKHKWLDLPYTNLPDGPKLDIYLPENGGGPYPVLVYIHGGAFLIGHKRVAYMEPLFYVLQRGYALVSIDYSLSGETEFPTPVYEVKTAIRWLREHGAEYNLQTERIAVLGDSAGGHLAAITGTSGAAGELEDDSLGSSGYSSAVQAVVDWFGPTRFEEMAGQLQELGAMVMNPGGVTMEELFLGDKLANIPDKVRAANPETYITENTPPFLIQHGDKDTVVPCGQSVTFAAAIRGKTGGRHLLFEILEGAVHEDPRFYAKENLDKVLDFLDQHIK